MKKFLFIAFLAFATNAKAQYTKLFDFNGINGDQPFGSVILSANDSVLYGMTAAGDSTEGGVIFSIKTNGTGFTSLHNFNQSDTGTGIDPYGSLIRSGNILYGMTNMGGHYEYGTIFSINTNGTGFTTLHSFNSVNGANPYGTLTISGDTLYGTTWGLNGANGQYGNIFSIHTNGTGYTDLLEFNDTDGWGPGYGALVLSGNTLYGTTMYGGGLYYHQGVLFSIHTNGSGFTDLLEFNTSNGSMPLGSVILSGNVLYGTATSGGYYDDGLIYSIHTDGTNFKDLLDFDGTSNGQSPEGSLIINGNILYGTTVTGGNYDFGTVFSVDTNGLNYHLLYSFNTPFGQEPRSQLSLCDSTLYGTAVIGGLYADGVIYSLNLLHAGVTDYESSIGNINLFPNPATDNLTVEAPPPATIEITNIQGQLIETLATTGNKTNIDVSSLAIGMCFVKVKTERGVAVKKFIKE